MKLSTGKRRIALWAEHVVIIRIRRIGRLETNAKSPRRIFHDDNRTARLAGNSYRLSVQGYAVHARERSEHSRSGLTGDDPAKSPTKCFLDGEIIGSRSDIRTLKTSRSQRV